MPNALDYYEYAKLATAAYVLLEGEPSLAGDRIAFQANDQKRLPEKLANQTFDSNSPDAVGSTPWTIPPGGYHGNDAEGFAATLFQRTSSSGATEKVLAIRGTEPSISPFGDLLKADLGQIGFLGLAMGQAVSMMNYILQMQADTTNYQVKQYVLEFSATQPANGYGIPLQASPTDPIKGYLYLAETVTTVNGLGLIAPGEKTKGTGVDFFLTK